MNESLASQYWRALRVLIVFRMARLVEHLLRQTARLVEHLPNEMPIASLRALRILASLNRRALQILIDIGIARLVEHLLKQHLVSETFSKEYFVSESWGGKHPTNEF